MVTGFGGGARGVGGVEVPLRPSPKCTRDRPGVRDLWKNMQLPHQRELGLEATEVLVQVEQRAANLFVTRQYWCAESVFLTLNLGLGGGLDADTALRLASGLGEGVGGSGCVCGGLNGGALAIGLLLGNSRPGWATKRDVMQAVRLLHSRFKQDFGSTCCRVLTKPVTAGSAAHFELCARHTGSAARMAARIVLARRPDILSVVDWKFLKRRDSAMGAGFRIASGRFKIASGRSNRG